MLLVKTPEEALSLIGTVFFALFEKRKNSLSQIFRFFDMAFKIFLPI